LEASSRTLWLGVGNRNTSFFQRMANLRRKFNVMSSMIVDGSLFEDLNHMKPSIHGLYKALFFESEAWRPKIDDLSMLAIRFS